MTTIELINYVMDNIPKLKNKNNFIDESDIFFLNDYFDRSQILFLLMENLENYENNESFGIADNDFDDVTKSVRKVSKKYRDAAKLLHILKKPNFRAFFNSVQQLDNQTYIPKPYTGILHEIDINFRVVNQLDNLKDSASFSETISNNSEISEESEAISHAKINLPAYPDIQYKIPNIDEFDSDFQIIGVTRDHKQPLGITVTKHNVNDNETKCMVERILVNSIIDKQGLLQVGDIIYEVNDESVDNPEVLQRIITKSAGTLNFKIRKSLKRPMSNMVSIEKSFVRALFDYDPSTDKLIPSENIGLSFSCGDVFEVLNRDDPNFWQVLPLDCTDGQALLVPSQLLQERRIALEDDLKSHESHATSKISRRKSKKNELFRAQDSADIISEADLRTYEEVVKFPPSRVPCLLLIGPTGIGKKALKHMLVQKEPNRFAFPIQDTTEPKRGRNQPLFNHIEKNIMMYDIKACHYVCLEETSGEMYGIKSSTIRELINQNKTVVLDCKPKDVYSLKLPIFNPCVILIAAPQINILEAMQKEGFQRNLTKNKRSTAELQDIIDQSNNFQKVYQHLINFVITNESFIKTVQTISSIVSEFENSYSWIPAAWENDIIPLPIVSTDSRDSIKSPDNISVGQTTLQRRFEKKGQKSSVSLPSTNTILPIGKSQDDYYSDSSSGTYSENEIVKAKPVKYVSEKSEPGFINEDKHIEIKSKQILPLTKRSNKSLIKEDSVKINDDLYKTPKNTQPSMEININKKPNSKSNLRYSLEEREPDYIVDDDHVEIQPKQMLSSTKRSNKSLNKEDSVDLNKSTKNAQPSMEININKKPSIKSNLKNPQDKDKEGVHSREKVKVKLPEKATFEPHQAETVKLKNNESVKLQNKESIKLQNNENIKLQNKESVKIHVKPINNQEKDQHKLQGERNKPQEKERIKLEEREKVKLQDLEKVIKPQEKVQQNITIKKDQNRSKIIKLKESSSSDMSDTTSEDESLKLRENRV